MKWWLQGMSATALTLSVALGPMNSFALGFSCGQNKLDVSLHMAGEPLDQNLDIGSVNLVRYFNSQCRRQIEAQCGKENAPHRLKIGDFTYSVVPSPRRGMSPPIQRVDAVCSWDAEDRDI